MKRLRHWSVLVLAAGLIFLVLFQSLSDNRTKASRAQSAPAREAEEAPEIGYLAPSFSLAGIDGSLYKWRQFRGKPVVLNFWASWCGPCKDEAPSFVKLHDTYKKELTIIAINLTAADSEKSAREFADEYGFSFPVLLDKDGSVAKRYKIRPIPSTFFIDKDGYIVDGVLGSLGAEDLKIRAEKLLRPDLS
ncbi:peroxiredoxin family protein [Cohnella faecalis]|nr:TlpA disulfide reductase family protein [Cohnella faecalis]